MVSVLSELLDDDDDDGHIYIYTIFVQAYFLCSANDWHTYQQNLRVFKT